MKPKQVIQYIFTHLTRLVSDSDSSLYILIHMSVHNCSCCSVCIVFSYCISLVTLSFSLAVWLCLQVMAKCPQKKKKNIKSLKITITVVGIVWLGNDILYQNKHKQTVLSGGEIIKRIKISIFFLPLALSNKLGNREINA